MSTSDLVTPGSWYSQWKETDTCRTGFVSPVLAVYLRVRWTVPQKCLLLGAWDDLLRYRHLCNRHLHLVRVFPTVTQVHQLQNTYTAFVYLCWVFSYTGSWDARYVALILPIFWGWLAGCLSTESSRCCQTQSQASRDRIFQTPLVSTQDIWDLNPSSQLRGNEI